MRLITKQVTAVDNAATGRLAREARTKAGLSLREVARRLDLSAPYVGDLELGRRGWTAERVIEYRKALL
jgi:transcriptional regulator with XRE-family HTH domain